MDNKYIRKDGRCVRVQTLNWLLKKARKAGIDSIRLTATPGGKGTLIVRFKDGVIFESAKSDFNRLVDFLRSRRSWRDLSAKVQNAGSGDVRTVLLGDLR